MTSRLIPDGLALASVIVGLAVFGLAPEARADEVKQQLNTPMILNMLSRPVDSADAALKESLRRDAAPRAPRSDEGEVLPDGSVRYGRGNASMTITVRNPCPPGDLAHEAAAMRPLPGRSRR